MTSQREGVWMIRAISGLMYNYCYHLRSQKFKRKSSPAPSWRKCEVQTRAESAHFVIVTSSVPLAEVPQTGGWMPRCAQTETWGCCLWPGEGGWLAGRERTPVSPQRTLHSRGVWYPSACQGPPRGLDLLLISKSLRGFQRLWPFLQYSVTLKYCVTWWCFYPGKLDCGECQN